MNIEKIRFNFPKEKFTKCTKIKIVSKKEVQSFLKLKIETTICASDKGIIIEE